MARNDYRFTVEGLLQRFAFRNVPRREGEAAAAIFDRYVERPLALARTRISAKLRRRVGLEDVVQSAYRSFFLHAQNREYQLDRSGDLWRLLASTTLHKRLIWEVRGFGNEVGS